MSKLKWKRAGVAVLTACALAGATGCLQLELAIEMHEEDGGATLTKRARFSETLLNLEKGRDGNVELARHLEREAAQARMAHMGEGVVLKSHTVEKLDGGSRESVAVYRIPDIEDLRLPSPFVQNSSPAPLPRLRFHFSPVYERRSGRDVVGSIGLSWREVESESGSQDEAAASFPETPLDFQEYRDLMPVFADMMSDFEVKVVLTVPGQPATHGRSEGDRRITLLHFQHGHTDRHAEPLISNEEAMLALLQLKLDDAAITEHTRHFPRYEGVPVHRGRSNYGSTHFRIWPTRHLFQKYFAGRPKSQGGDQ